MNLLIKSNFTYIYIGISEGGIVYMVYRGRYICIYMYLSESGVVVAQHVVGIY